MEKYMNAPMESSWTVQDIIAEYMNSNDKKTISRRYQIPVSEVTKILKGTAICGKQGRSAFLSKVDAGLYPEKSSRFPGTFFWSGMGRNKEPGCVLPKYTTQKRKHKNMCMWKNRKRSGFGLHMTIGIRKLQQTFVRNLVLRFLFVLQLFQHSINVGIC